MANEPKKTTGGFKMRCAIVLVVLSSLIGISLIGPIGCSSRTPHPPSSIIEFRNRVMECPLVQNGAHVSFKTPSYLYTVISPSRDIEGAAVSFSGTLLHRRVTSLPHKDEYGCWDNDPILDSVYLDIRIDGWGEYSPSNCEDKGIAHFRCDDPQETGTPTPGEAVHITCHYDKGWFEPEDGEGDSDSQIQLYYAIIYYPELKLEETSADEDSPN